MKTYIILLVLLAACAQTTDTHTIAVIGPMTGEDARFGEQMRMGIELAAINYPSIEVQYLDDKSDSTSAISAYLSGEYDAVIGTLSHNGNAIAPLAQENQDYFCSIASDPEISANRPYVFTHVTTPEAQAKQFLELANKNGWESFGIIDVQHAGVKAATNALVDLLETERMDLQVVTLQPSDVTVNTELLLLGDVDAYVLILFPNQVLSVGEVLAEQGNTKPVTAIESFDYIEDASLFEGETYVGTAIPTTSFNAMFADHFSENAYPYSAFGYDCFNILVQALSAPDGLSYLRSIDNYPGAVGSVTMQNGRLQSPVAVKEIRDGKPMIIDI